MTPPERTFPRGLVLGLTMAETLILIVFVLLLALTALLGRETDRRRDAERDLEQFEEIRLTLAERGLADEPEEILNLLKARSEDQNYADNWRDLVRELDPQIPEPSPAEIVSSLNEANEALDRNAAHQALDEALRNRGVQPTPKAFADMVRDADRWRNHAGAVENDLAAALDQANERTERLQAQVQGGGGTDHPSCWYDDDGTVAYLFDAALLEDGYILQPARAPQHQRKRTALPLEPVLIGRTLSPTEFLEQTRPVFNWSVANKCRFFVRAFDLTAADQKELYKRRMRTLESHFYKNASPSGPFPFTLDSAVGW